MTSSSPATNSEALLIIDSRVQVPEQWLAVMAENITVHRVSPDQDGLSQIAAIMAFHEGVGSVHFVSHGVPGALVLGNSQLDTAALMQNAALLRTIGAQLAPGADLLLYGCDVGAGEAGQFFVDTLARLTGANVAASDDATGDSVHGGNWILETVRGFIRTPVLHIAGLPGTLSTPGNDTIVGTIGNDTLYGGDGNDQISAQAGDDWLYGEGGNDSLAGFDGNDSLYGGLNDDLLLGLNQDDYLSGGDGNDTLSGGAGNDMFFGDDGNDVLRGSTGDDVLYGGAGNDGVSADAGNDTLYGGAGTDTLVGGADNDIFIGSAADFDGDTITDFSMSDSLVVTGADLSALDATAAGAALDLGGGQSLALTGITAASGNFSAIFSGGDTTITLVAAPTGPATVALTTGADTPALTTFDDTITAGLASSLNAGDVINGQGGADTLEISAAQTAVLGATTLTNVETITITAGIQNITTHDATAGTGQTLTIDASASTSALTWNGSAETDGIFAITGGSANDSILGGAGADTLRGGDGNDTLSGNAGSDLFYGEGNNDTLYGGAGLDTLYGGDGNDFLYSGIDNDLIYGDGGNDGISGDIGDDTIYGGTGNDTLIGGDGNDTLVGSDGNDWIWGQNSDDVIYGGLGSDTLSGHDGNDTLYGGDDNDTLSGFAGNDTLYGDAGNDAFKGSAADLDGDTIADFTVNDSIVVSGVDLSALNGTTASAALDLGGGQSLALTDITAASGNFSAIFSGGNTTITLIVPTGPLTAVLTTGVDAPGLTSFDDTITAGLASSLNAGDVINGQGGADTLEISAAQTVVLGATTLTNVETITITAGIQNITTHDATVGTGQTLTIDASASTSALTWNGSAETDGIFAITGGSANDSILGGAGADTLRGGDDNDTLSGFGGNDTLYGDAGNDAFGGSAADLDGDTIADFAVGDSIVITGVDLSALNGTTASVTIALSSGQSLTLTGITAGSGTFAAVFSGGNTTITLVAPVPEPEPEPEPPAVEQIDGVSVQTTEDSAGNQTVTIPVVTASREDDPSTSLATHAEVPVATNASGQTVLTLGVPVGSGATVQGPAAPLAPSAATSSLLQSIAVTGAADPTAIAAMNESASTWLESLPANSMVTVKTIVPTIQSSQSSFRPILVSGTVGEPVALVIDARSLPQDSVLQLDNIDFAAIVGSATILGGAGSNQVVGDDASQVIILGMDDDSLQGGGGNDTVGSLTGNDQTFGDAGDDKVYGGAGHDSLSGGLGNDSLNGGFGFDTALAAESRADYNITVEGDTVVLTHLTSGEVDRLTDVEQVHFFGGEVLTIAHSEMEAVAYHLVNTWLHRNLTLEEAQHVQNIEGASIEDLVQTFKALLAPEDVKQLGTAELLAGLEDNPAIIRLSEQRKAYLGDAGDNHGYLPMGAALAADGVDGHDVLRLEGGRDDYDLQANDGALLITRYEDGAMLSLRNAELLSFDSGETTVLAHGTVESILGRLVQTFFARNATVEEWQLGRSALAADVGHEQILDWFEARAGLEQLSDSDYIQALYQNTFGRQANATELQAQLARLDDQNFDRSLLAIDIAQSDEAITTVGSVINFDNWI